MGLLDGWEFCPRCAAPLDGGPPRRACVACGFVAYAHSVPGAEVVLRDGEGRILLGRRVFDPAAGLWDLPGGFVEEGEHPVEGLCREVREETGLELAELEFLDFYLEPYDGRIVLCLTWTARGHGSARAGDDLAELRWFATGELPAPGELAFSHYPAALSAAVARHEDA